MNCPVCGSKTIVHTCRRDCEGVYRVRDCVNEDCKHRFYTTEVESDREDYDRISRVLNNERYRRRYKKA